jgi:hypothetical protein
MPPVSAIVFSVWLRVAARPREIDRKIDENGTATA